MNLNKGKLILICYSFIVYHSNIDFFCSDGEDVFCFTVKFMTRPQSILFGALCTTERLVWMQKFLGSVTSFPIKISSEFNRAGCVTLKVQYLFTYN